MDTNTLATDIAENLEQVARGYRILAANGHSEGTLGHLSWRDPNGRGLWMKCQEVGIDEVEPKDLQLIDWDGKVLEGDSAETVLERARQALCFSQEIGSNQITIAFQK